MIHQLIKMWHFDNASRELTTINSPDKARLNAENKADPRLQLKSIGKDVNKVPIYSTDDDITITTELTEPNAVRKWLGFEPEFTTNEEDLHEFSMVIDDKSGNEFSFDEYPIFPKVGDRVYQGDFSAVIDSFALTGNLILDDATNFNNGRVYVLRSKCDMFFRLYDKAGNRFYWDGAAWVAPTTSDHWNTMFQINNHVSTFPIATSGKGIGFDIKLKTSDKYFTPVIRYLKLLGEFEIEFAEDIIFDTIIQTMKDTMEVTTEIIIDLGAATDTIDFAGEYKLEKQYLFTEGYTAYNLDDDPFKLINLVDSYTAGVDGAPGQLKLTSIQDANKRVVINMKYIPVISVTTGQDYYEIEHTPSIVFERIEKQNPVVSERSDIARNSVRDRLTLTGVRLHTPSINDLLFEYAVHTGNQSDQERLEEALQRLLNVTHHFTSWGLDEPYPVFVRDVFRSTNNPDASDFNTHIGGFKLGNVVTAIGLPETVQLANTLVFGMSTK